MGKVLTDNEIDMLLKAISGDDFPTEDINQDSNTRKILIHDFLSPRVFSNQDMACILPFAKEIFSQVSVKFSNRLKIEMRYSLEETEYLTREMICRDGRYDPLQTESFFCEAELQDKQKLFLAMNVSDIKKISKKEMPKEQFKSICEDFVNSIQNLTQKEVKNLSIVDSAQETSLNPLLFSYYTPKAAALYQLLSHNSDSDGFKTGYGDYSYTYEGEKDSCCIVKVTFFPIKKKNFSITVFLIFPHDFAKSICQNNENKEIKNEEKFQKEISFPDFLDNVMVNLTVSLGHTCRRLEDIYNIREGIIIELSNSIGEPVTVYSDKKAIAKAELIVIDGVFGIRIIETL